ncbi:uncharacterized protein [Watersipora subatra]|uniref:uncharacterized protein n=1 Tax=Watersipora subatra TaxID=2589382 RepID=UPI00355C7DC4
MTLKRNDKICLLTLFLCFNLLIKDTVATIQCKGKATLDQAYGVSCMSKGLKADISDNQSCLIKEREDNNQQCDSSSSCTAINIKLLPGQFLDSNDILWSFASCYQKVMSVQVCADISQVPPTTSLRPRSTQHLSTISSVKTSFLQRDNASTTLSALPATNPTSNTTSLSTSALSDTTATASNSSTLTTTLTSDLTSSTTDSTTSMTDVTTSPSESTTSTTGSTTSATESTTSTTESTTSTTESTTSTTESTTSTTEPTTSTTGPITSTTESTTSTTESTTSTTDPTTSTTDPTTSTTDPTTSTTDSTTSTTDPTTSTTNPTTSTSGAAASATVSSTLTTNSVSSVKDSTSRSSTSTSPVSSQLTTTTSSQSSSSLSLTTEQKVPQFEGCFSGIVTFSSLNCSAQAVNVTLSQGNMTAEFQVQVLGCCSKDNCKPDDGKQKPNTCNYGKGKNVVSVPCASECFTYLIANSTASTSNHGCLDDLYLSETPFADAVDCSETYKEGSCLDAGNNESISGTFDKHTEFSETMADLLLVSPTSLRCLQDEFGDTSSISVLQACLKCCTSNNCNTFESKSSLLGLESTTTASAAVLTLSSFLFLFNLALAITI